MSSSPEYFFDGHNAVLGVERHDNKYLMLAGTQKQAQVPAIELPHACALVKIVSLVIVKLHHEISNDCVCRNYPQGLLIAAKEGMTFLA